MCNNGTQLLFYWLLQCRHGKSALQHAVSNTGTVCLCQLIDAGANPDAGDSLGCTPLWHAACTDGCLLPLQKLIAAGASVNVRDAREKRIPLQVRMEILLYSEMHTRAGEND